MEATECGAAALGIVLGHHGSHIPLEKLREACGISRDGSKASNILKAARRYGLTAKGFKKELEQLYMMQMPVILHWNFNHFLVLEGFQKDKVYLNDPATGPRTVSGQDLDAAYTGVVLTFEPGEEFMPAGSKPSPLPSLLARLDGSRRALLFVFLAGLGLVVPGLILPVFTRVFVDQILVAGHDSWFRPLLLGMAMTAVVRGVLMWLQSRFLLRLTLKLSISMSGQFLWHVLRLPIGFFQARRAGDIATRVQINDRLASMLSGSLVRMLLDCILAIFYVALMLLYDPVLTVVVVAIASVNIGVLRMLGRTRTDQSLRVQQERGKLVGMAMTGIMMIESLKASGSEDDFFSNWAGQHAKVLNAEQRMAVTTQIFGVVPTVLTALNTAVLLSLGAIRVMDGHMTMGMLVAYQSLMSSFIGPINALIGFAGNWQVFQGDLTRLDDVLGHEQDALIAADNTAQRITKARLDGEVTIRGLRFGYNPLAPALIDGLDLDLSPGSRVALVGGSGSGKSTIAKLVAGLLEPWEGEIRFDGQRRSELQRRVLTTSMGVVDQDIFLFGGTVRENLSLWDETVADETIIAAAKAACIHEDIMRLPGGYDATVEEGGRNFSGGQRQRLEIARALCTNPTILILDEAMSALDVDTERRIDRNLRRRGCTCLIVAHRLSTIRDCDEIVVLDSGKIVERGTHESLWAAGGHYAGLVGTM
jgi:NHLM bacteriocin system ABC transporter peptidase/ATP-binding protein